MTTRQSQKNPVLMFIKRLNYDVFLILRGSQQATKCHPSSGLSLCEANGIIGQAWNRCRRLCIFNRYCNAHCSGHNCSQGRSSLASGVPCLSDGPAYTTRMGGRGHPRHRRMSNDISYCKPDKSTRLATRFFPEHVGPYIIFNSLAYFDRSDVLVRFDADDIMLQGYLQAQLRLLNSSLAPMIIQTWSTYVD